MSVIVALDYPSSGEALSLARQLSPELCRVKVGKELFTRAGPALVEQLQSLGFEVFLDLKFHDIPNTVAGALRAGADKSKTRAPATGSSPSTSRRVTACAGGTVISVGSSNHRMVPPVRMPTVAPERAGTAKAKSP